MKLDDLKPGMYEISADVKNPKADRRKPERDFTACTMWQKGKRVCVEADQDFPDLFRIYPIPGYSYLGVNGRKGGKRNHPGFEALVEALSPVEWTHHEWISAHIQNGNFVLEKLLESGKLTREDIRAVVKWIES